MRRILPGVVAFFAIILILALPVRGQTTPSSAPRYSSCDLCGYCPPNSPPQSWTNCRACLYPTTTPFPATANQTLLIDPATGEAPTPYPGHQYTGVGCLATNLGSFAEPGAAQNIAQTLLNIIFSVAGGIAFLYLLYGAYILATSQANPERLNYGKRVVAGALIGLIFCLSSLFIIRIVVSGILKIPGL